MSTLIYVVRRNEKYQNILSENFPFLLVKFSIYLNRHVFVMCTTSGCVFKLATKDMLCWIQIIRFEYTCVYPIDK